MVLTKDEIIDRINESEKHTYKFIDPYRIENVKSASYDLTLGNEYYICSEREKPDIKRLGTNEDMVVPPRATFFVISEEKLCIPLDICASVSLAFGLIRKGIIFAVQPPIDPGYHGAIVALLHNMSDEEITLQHGMHILNIVYYQLVRPVSAEDAYKGEYNDITLEKFCTQAVTHSAIVNLANEARKARDKAEQASKQAEEASNEAKNASHKTLSTIITIITVLLAVITILLTAATVFLSIKAFQPTSKEQTTQTEQTASTVQREGSIAYDFANEIYYV